jgi:hypothetical protein
MPQILPHISDMLKLIHRVLQCVSVHQEIRRYERKQYQSEQRTLYVALSLSRRVRDHPFVSTSCTRHLRHTAEPGGVTCYLCTRANRGPRLDIIFTVKLVGATSLRGIVRSMALYHTCKFM